MSKVINCQHCGRLDILGLRVALFATLFGICTAVSGASWIELRDQGVLRQERDLSCGAASVAMLLNALYAESLTEDDVLKRSSSSDRVAATVADMLRMIEAIGYQGKAKSVTFDQLKKLLVPAVAFIRPDLGKLGLGHFVFLEQVAENSVVYRDPSYGLRTVSLDLFRRMWLTRADTASGVLIFAMPSNPGQAKAFSEYSPPTRRHWSPLIPGF